MKLDRDEGSDLWGRITSGDVFFVAEIGKGFIQTEEERTRSEYLANAKELIDAAQAAGADAVKFQTHIVEDEQAPIDVVSPHFDGADRYSWVRRNTEATPREFWQELRNYCDERGIVFFSTPMSRGAAQVLAEVGVDAWKVGSGDILDFVMLDYLRRQPEPVIVSSGMSSLAELDLALKYLRGKSSRVALLHCVSKYPCGPEELHLNTIPFLAKRYDVPIGFSDHSLGFGGVLAAVALGACVIEKHFSLSRELWGSDHKVSMVPKEFAAMVERVRSGEVTQDGAEEYLGPVIEDELPDSDSEFRPLFRKTLVAARDLAAGEVVRPKMVQAMRPQAYLDGLPSERYRDVVGRRCLSGVGKGEPLTAEAVGLKEIAGVAT